MNIMIISEKSCGTSAGYSPAVFSAGMMQNSTDGILAVNEGLMQDRTLSCVRSSLTVYEYLYKMDEADV